MVVVVPVVVVVIYVVDGLVWLIVWFGLDKGKILNHLSLFQSLNYQFWVPGEGSCR